MRPTTPLLTFHIKSPIKLLTIREPDDVDIYDQVSACLSKSCRYSSYQTPPDELNKKLLDDGTPDWMV